MGLCVMLNGSALSKKAFTLFLQVPNYYVKQFTNTFPNNPKQNEEKKHPDCALFKDSRPDAALKFYCALTQQPSKPPL